MKSNLPLKKLAKDLFGASVEAYTGSSMLGWMAKYWYSNRINQTVDIAVKFLNSVPKETTNYYKSELSKLINQIQQPTETKEHSSSFIFKF